MSEYIFSAQTLYMPEKLHRALSLFYFVVVTILISNLMTVKQCRPSCEQRWNTASGPWRDPVHACFLHKGSLDGCVDANYIKLLTQTKKLSVFSMT